MDIIGNLNHPPIPTAFGIGVVGCGEAERKNTGTDVIVVSPMVMVIIPCYPPLRSGSGLAYDVSLHHHGCNAIVSNHFHVDLIQAGKDPFAKKFRC